MKTILILESNPRKDLNLNEEIRDLRGVIERSRHREDFLIQIGTAVRTEDLQRLMLAYEPHIVHFCGHGSGETGLVFQDELGREQRVTAAALSELFRLNAERLECVVLNACYSQVQADAIVQHIDYAIGMRQAIRDDAAQHFAQGFYQALGYGKHIEVAYEWGCNAIQLMLANEQMGNSSVAVPEHRKTSRKPEGQQQVIPEYLKPVLSRQTALASTQSGKQERQTQEGLETSEQNLCQEELETLNQILCQEKAMERYRAQVRAFLVNRRLSKFEQIRLRQLRRTLGLSEAVAAQILAEEETPRRRAQHEYEEMLISLIEEGQYPFDAETQRELEKFREWLGLKEAEIIRIEEPLFAVAEQEQPLNLAQPFSSVQKSVAEASVGTKGLDSSTRTDCLTTREGLQLDLFEFQTVTLRAIREGRAGWRGEPKVSLAQQWKSGQAEYFQEDLGHGVVLEMVRIPAGEFLMGAEEGEEGASDEEYPRHRVRVPEFFLGKFVVTQVQYQAVMGENPSTFRGDRQPVEQVNWDDAQAFCKKLSQMTGRDYRLPSEAEWEYACRAGMTTPFHFGETISTDLANYQGQDWKYEGRTYPGRYGLGPLGSFRGKTAEVGSCLPNAFGLYDMHGNVWEWCEDRWHSNYRDAPYDSAAWKTAVCEEFYVVRGGAWRYGPWVCRSANRGYFAPRDRDSSIGFRVVCVRPKGLL